MSALLAPVDVAVVGAGPVGLALAAMLAAQGVAVAVVERSEAPHTIPRAAHLDATARAILARAGVAADGRPISGFDLVDRRGRVLLAAEAAGGDGRLIHQPTVEADLRARLAALGVPLLPGHEVTGLASDADGGITVGVTGVAGGAPFRLAARLVVGADGAASTVRRLVGAPLVDSVRGGFAQRWLVVDVRLARDVLLPTRLQQIADPAAPATYVPFGGDRRRWEFRLAPGEPDADALASVPRRLAAVVPAGTPEGAVEVERAAVYTFRAVVARGWRRGRVLLAGDAAHQMPPFLGAGLGAGLRDAAWLADALPRALAGDDRALDGYEAERSRHVRATTRVAVQIGRLVTLPDPWARARDAMLAGASRARGRPPTIRRDVG